MKKFTLNINTDGEIIHITQTSGHKIVNKTDHLMIASTLIESYYELITGTVEPDDGAFTFAENKLDLILGTANIGEHLRAARVSTETDILHEIKCLRYAVINWVDKQTLRIEDFDLSITNEAQLTPDSQSALFLERRMCECPPKPLFIGGLARLHESDELICLAWAEIWYAIENHIRARCCPYCGVVFLLPQNNPRKTNCLRPSCKMKYEIDRHGGIESYREWERNRKKVPSKRKVGRPKKEG